MASELTAFCGAVGFSDLPADPSAFPPLGTEQREIDLTSVAGEAEFFDNYDWLVADRSEDVLMLFGRPTSANGDNPAYASATFRREGDRWIPEGWGGCRIEVSAPGWGNARFVLDPAVEPNAGTTALSVLATERACASGRPPEGREVHPVLVAQDEETVSIVVLVEPPKGDQDCPGNPPFTLTVDIGSALGDRTILDASLQPPLSRPWPPTESSLNSNGLTE